MWGRSEWSGERRGIPDNNTAKTTLKCCHRKCCEISQFKSFRFCITIKVMKIDSWNLSTISVSNISFTLHSHLPSSLFFHPPFSPPQTYRCMKFERDSPSRISWTRIPSVQRIDWRSTGWAERCCASWSQRSSWLLGKIRWSNGSVDIKSKNT